MKLFLGMTTVAAVILSVILSPQYCQASPMTWVILSLLGGGLLSALVSRLNHIG
jgi:RsiW-degrading membrane proteinase PrsW (M82 family)